MLDPDDPTAGFTTTRWDDGGFASIEAAGTDQRSALESGLRAVLTLVVAPVHAPDRSGRSAPIRGEGDDLANLFADIAEDLLGQIEYFGCGLHYIVVDGVVRREGGGFVGWWYATGTLEPTPPPATPRLLSDVAAVNEGMRVIIRARLHQP